jgi:hypothetical protein
LTLRDIIRRKLDILKIHITILSIIILGDIFVSLQQCLILEYKFSKKTKNESLHLQYHPSYFRNYSIPHPSYCCEFYLNPNFSPRPHLDVCQNVGVQSVLWRYPENPVSPLAYLLSEARLRCLEDPLWTESLSRMWYPPVQLAGTVTILILTLQSSWQVK